MWAEPSAPLSCSFEHLPPTLGLSQQNTKEVLRAAVKGLQELSEALWDVPCHMEQVARFSSLASEKQLVFLVLGLFFFFFFQSFCFLVAKWLWQPGKVLANWIITISCLRAGWKMFKHLKHCPFTMCSHIIRKWTFDALSPFFFFLSFFCRFFQR